MVWLIIVVQIDSVEAEWEYIVYVYLIISNVSNAKIIYLPCLCQCAVTDLIPILYKNNVLCFFPPSINFIMQVIHICTLIDSNMYKCTLF